MAQCQLRARAVAPFPSTSRRVLHLTGSASFAESLYGLRRVAVGDKGADASGAARKPLSRPKMRVTLLLLVR